MNEHDITADAAVRIANAIEGVCNGEETAAVYLALGMVLGVRGAQGERPDIDGLFKVIRRVADNEFKRRMAERGWH